MRTRRAWYVALAAVLWLGTPGLAQQARVLEPGTAVSVGMDEAKLQQAVKLYRDALERGEIRGAVLLVARGGTIVVHEAMGWKNYAYKLPMTKDTIFQMASTTKPVTATAVLMLEDEGKLNTKDPVANYFESFRNPKAQALTIHHMLTGTSGFRINSIFLPFEKDEKPALRTAVDKFGKEGAKVAPDISFSYSNAAFNVAAALVEQVSGMPLHDFFIKRIYEPLGMVDTRNHDDLTKLQRYATHYGARVDDQGKVQWSRSYTPGDPPDWPVTRGSGGLITTAIDYAKFLQMWLDGGVYSGGRMLSAAAVKKATTGYIPTAACPEAAKPCNTLTPYGVTEGIQYGMGWYVADDGVYSHLGGSANNGRFIWVDPKRDIIGVALTTGGNDPRRAFLEMIQQSVGGS